MTSRTLTEKCLHIGDVLAGLAKYNEANALELTKLKCEINKLNEIVMNIQSQLEQKNKVLYETSPLKESSLEKGK